MSINYSFEMFEYDPAITEHGLETHPPVSETVTIDDFTEGEHFRTKAEVTDPHSLTLSTDNKLLTLLVDESGSATWNDKNGDRYVFLKRLLGILDQTYPGAIQANLYGFGGTQVITSLFALPMATASTADSTQEFNTLLKESFQDSIYDLSEIVIIRNSDHYPSNPHDGVTVFRGIAEAAKDEYLTEGQTYYYGIWSLNSKGEYDAGQFIKGTPRDRDLPNGVVFAEATSRVLPGIERDEYTQVIYSFLEKSGSFVFDSSGTEKHGTISSDTILSSFWAGDAASSSTLIDSSIKKTTGARFNGINNAVEADCDDTLNISNEEYNNSSITANFWAYRYPNLKPVWVAGLTSSPASNDIGWAIGITNNGNLGIGTHNAFKAFYGSKGLTEISDTFIPEKEWTMATIELDADANEARAYINGEFKNSISLGGDIKNGYDHLEIGGRNFNNEIVIWLEIANILDVAERETIISGLKRYESANVSHTAILTIKPGYVFERSSKHDANDVAMMNGYYELIKSRLPNWTVIPGLDIFGVTLDPFTTGDWSHISAIASGVCNGLNTKTYFLKTTDSFSSFIFSSVSPTEEENLANLRIEMAKLQQDISYLWYPFIQSHHTTQFIKIIRAVSDSLSLVRFIDSNSTITPTAYGQAVTIAATAAGEVYANRPCLPLLSCGGTTGWTTERLPNAIRYAFSDWTILANSTTTELFFGQFADALATDMEANGPLQTWSGSGFFGSLNQVSISNAMRGEEYLGNLYINEKVIFDDSLIPSLQDEPDNGQREVLLQWTVPDDFDYTNISIRRKYNEPPSHENDGDLVACRSAIIGTDYFVDSYDFINNGNYYYRIFTENTLGNFCDRQESRLLGVNIQRYRKPVTGGPLPVINAQTTPGNKKVLIQWENQIDDSRKGIKIFYGSHEYPHLDWSTQNGFVVTNGSEIADITDNYFIHRSNGLSDTGSVVHLINGEKHFYTIVAYDQIGRYSDPEMVYAIPTERTVKETGVATSATSNSLTDSSKNMTVNAYEDYSIIIKTGTGEGQERAILSNTANSFTITEPWEEYPSTDSAYEIYQEHVSFDPAIISDLHLDVVNPTTLSLGWKNPTYRANELDLWIGETAAIFANINDIMGESLKDVNNLKLHYCTKVEERKIATNERPLGIYTLGDSNSYDGLNTPFAGSLSNCNQTYNGELRLNSSSVQSGLVKGIILVNPDRSILARRQKYVVDIWAQYNVEDTETNTNLFQYNTTTVRVNFEHPMRISVVNKDSRKVSVPCSLQGRVRGEEACPCANVSRCKEEFYNGTFANARQPYIARIELQYKGEALPGGTSVSVSAWKSGTDLTQKPTRAAFTDGLYPTTAIEEEETDTTGTATNRIISKSIVDIPIEAPALPEDIDLYVSIEYNGLFIDAIHSVRFLGILRVILDTEFPYPDGNDVGKQRASVFLIDPDFPNDSTKQIPVPDATIVKWELIPGRFGKERPFYSTDYEALGLNLQGVYSLTENSIATNVFFGPVSDIKNHNTTTSCGGEQEDCCIGEEYSIRATAIYEDLTATDEVIYHYKCSEEETTISQKFLMNVAAGQSGNYPHWIIWSDGESMLKVEIARNPALSNIPKADCFRECVLSNGGSLIELPDDQIVSITGPGEIIWNASFCDPYDPYEPYCDPYYDPAYPKFTDLVSYNSVTDSAQTNKVANIPLTDDTTTFYIRSTAFIGDQNPEPEKCDKPAATSDINLNDLETPLLDCEWKGLSSCIGRGRKWTNVQPLQGTTTLVSNNKQITLFSGGDYKSGIPPIYIGFREPLAVKIADLRINKTRVKTPIVDYISRHTFVIEISFAGNPVPDGTPVYIDIVGDDQNAVALSDCVGIEEGCYAASGGIVYTTQLNDSLLNPTGNVKSIAYFTIEPLPNITFNSTINVTCRYDKLGTTERSLTRTYTIQNTAAIDIPIEEPPDAPPETPAQEAKKNPAFSEALAYNTLTETFSDLAGPQVPRMGGFLSFSETTGQLYLAGGFTGVSTVGLKEDSFTATTETYRLEEDEYNPWVYLPDMPTPRAWGMTAYTNNEMYCIGGLEYDELLNQYSISKKIEKFNFESEEWSELSEMPDEYGVGWGSAEIYGDYIYVIGGITKINSDTFPEELNDRILRYSITNNSWDLISPSDENLYKRISPLAFLRSTPEPLTSIIDNLDVGFSVISGTWDTGGYSNKYGPNYRFSYTAASKTHEVQWSISDLKYSSQYEVFVWFNSGTNRSQKAPYTVHFSGGESTIEVNQHSSGDLGGRWVSIGTFLFEKDSTARVTLANNTSDFGIAGQVVIADAIKLVSTGDNNYQYYVYGGSVPKSSAEINAEKSAIVNKSLSDFSSKISGSSYFQSLSLNEQQEFVKAYQDKLNNQVSVPAYLYLSTGFIIDFGTEQDDGYGFSIDLIQTLETEWPDLPTQRDKGVAIYLPNQDSACFMGGSNQNKSTTLQSIERVHLPIGTFTNLEAFPQGLSNFMALEYNDVIYIVGGLTSGHSAGFTKVFLEQLTPYIEANGKETAPITIMLTNDAGELISEDTTVKITGRLRIEAIDNLLVGFLSKRAADRALGGDGSGTALASISGSISQSQLIAAQNNIIDPNSDEFQFDSSKRLKEMISLFPIIYSSTDITVQNGIGSTILEARSEDPLSEFEKLATYIKDRLAQTPVDPNQKFDGDLTREELTALGDVLSTLTTEPTVIYSGLRRNLYNVETKATVVDSLYFGETISGMDYNIQNATKQTIYNILDGSGSSSGGIYDGIDTDGLSISSTDTNPYSMEEYSKSGQSLSSYSLVPLAAAPSSQNSTLITTFFSKTDWVPQIKDRLVSNDSTLSDVIDELDKIDHEIPFGSSQIYDTMNEASRLLSNDSVQNIDKLIYVLSDNSSNTSTISRTKAIENINSIDGEKKVPIIYIAFNTSFPVTLSSQLERTGLGDAAKIAEGTNGRSIVFTNNIFTNQLINYALTSSGGLGSGLYRKRIELDEVSAITAMDISFSLPSNTFGSIRYRYSIDGYNFNDYSAKIKESSYLDVKDFFAKTIDIEIELATGFIEDAEDPYFNPTSNPEFISLTLYTSTEREDLIFVNPETVSMNVQQLAAAIEGSVPNNSAIEIGVAASNSTDWQDFATTARPAIAECGKTLLLERNRSATSIVPSENLTTNNYQLYFAPDGPWDPFAEFSLYSVDSAGSETEILDGFKIYPRQGQIYFSTKQDPANTFKISITNANILTIGIKVSNKQSTETVNIDGVGFIYSTNDDKPPVLYKAPPSATNVQVLPDSPTSMSTFTASYVYSDINGDPESDTIITWYKNGMTLYELQNKITWDNSNLSLTNKLQPYDQINFSVKPYDGRFYGPVILAHQVTIRPLPPTASDVKIIAIRNNVVSTTKFDTSSIFRVSYSFAAEGTDSDATVEDGTIIRWYVNGALFKEETYSAANPDPYTDPKNIIPGDLSNGIVAHTINNEIEVEVTPKTKRNIGETVKSSKVTVINSVPIIKNAKLSPSPANTRSYLELTYTMDDADILSGIQTDQSEIKWYKQVGTAFVEQIAYRNFKKLTPSSLAIGDKWQAEVTPYDGLELGSLVRSNIVLVSS